MFLSCVQLIVLLKFQCILTIFFVIGGKTCALSVITEHKKRLISTILYLVQYPRVCQAAREHVLLHSSLPLPQIGTI